MKWFWLSEATITPRVLPFSATILRVSWMVRTPETLPTRGLLTNRPFFMGLRGVLSGCRCTRM